MPLSRGMQLWTGSQQQGRGLAPSRPVVSRRRVEISSFYRRYSTVTSRPAQVGCGVQAAVGESTHRNRDTGLICGSPWLLPTGSHPYCHRQRLSSQSSSAQTATQASARAKVWAGSNSNGRLQQPLALCSWQETIINHTAIPTDAASRQRTVVLVALW